MEAVEYYDKILKAGQQNVATVGNTPKGYCLKCGMWWPHCNCDIDGRGGFVDAEEMDVVEHDDHIAVRFLSKSGMVSNTNEYLKLLNEAEKEIRVTIAIHDNGVETIAHVIYESHKKALNYDTHF